jgi:tetratricopeptide (TPR) repeat protein
MQRYRVNYVLLIALVVGFFASSGAAYGLWKFQVNRNAVRLLAKADAAEASGELEEAYKSLDQYVQFRPKEIDARIRLGEAAVKVAEVPEFDNDTRARAYQSVLAAVRDTDDPKLRRQLVELQTKYRQADLALINIDQLLDAGHGDAELKALKAECLFATQKSGLGEKWCNQLIGYDAKTDTFDPAKAEALNFPKVYALLAQYLSTTKRPELSERVVEQMIKANPDSREAYVLQYQFLKVADDQEGARAALDKAYELEPTDAVVLTLKGVEAEGAFQKAFATAEGADAEKREKAGKHLDEAAKYYAEALERYPERMDLYDRAARVELYREKPEDALAIIQKGIDKFPLKTEIDLTGLPRAIHLSNLKTEVLIGQKKFDEVQEVIKDLRALNNPRLTAVADFHEARLTAINEKWAEAASKLQRVRTRLVDFPELEGLAGALQGFCHTQMGQFDLALAAYEWALLKNPGLAQAKLGFEEMRKMVHPDAQEGNVLALDQKIKDEMAKPASEQDWAAVEAEIDLYITEEAAKRPVAATWADSRKQLMRAQMYAMRAAVETDEAKKKALFQEARKAIIAANKIDPKDPQIQLQAVRLLAQEPGSGPARALEQLDRIIKDINKGEETAPFRNLRIDLLAAIRDEDLPNQLDAATQGMEKWDANQQASVWANVSGKFEQLGKFPDAQRSLERAVELAPNSLPYRMALFDLSLKQADDAGMRRAQERVLEIAKSKTDPGYVLTEVKRRIVGSESGAATAEELKEARTLLEAAIKQRPEWSELHVANGQLYLVLEKDIDKALASFDEAQKYGASNLNAIGLQVRLLAERGRLEDARKRMAKIPESVWSAVLNRTAAQLLLSSGEPDKALVEAEKIAKSQPNDAATQTWYGEVALQAQKPEVAEAAFKKAIELNPSDPDAWTRMVSTYLQLKRPEDVERTLREAHLALDEEFLPLLTAKYYELQSRWQQAEDIYLSAYAGREDEIPVARRMAEFYLTWSEGNEANRGKAAVYLNKILRASNEGKLPKNDPTGLWARRQAARLFAMTRQYADSVKAERLLASAIEGGSATPEDKEQLIDVLSLRNDPGSRDRVVKLLREIQAERGLTAKRALHLGHMLHEINDWQASKDQMEDAIGRYPDDLDLQTAFASLLITRKEFNEAKAMISRLAQNKEAAGPVQELRLRLAAAQQDMKQVRDVLTGMTPDLLRLKPEQLQFVKSVAALADSVGDHEYALNMMREYARRTPGAELDLARLTALYGNLDEGLTLLQAQFDARMDDVMQVALEVLRKRRSEAPEKLDAELTRMVQQALRDDPESARRLVFQAEMLEVQEKFEESVAAYNKLLTRDDVPQLVRATALNNLAFLLALQSNKPEDLEQALNSVNEAISILGPISDILDTRALVYLANGQFAEAAADMKLSVMVGPTPSKYYHLAAAELGAGNEQGAKAAWDRAIADGLDPAKFTPLERPEVQEFIKKMEALGGATPTAQL